MKINYKVIGRYIGSTTEYVPYDDRNYEKCLKEYNKLKSKYGDHIRFKIIKVTEEVVKR